MPLPCLCVAVCSVFFCLFLSAFRKSFWLLALLVYTCPVSSFFFAVAFMLFMAVCVCLCMWKFQLIILLASPPILRRVSSAQKQTILNPIHVGFFGVRIMWIIIFFSLLSSSSFSSCLLLACFFFVCCRSLSVYSCNVCSCMLVSFCLCIVSFFFCGCDYYFTHTLCSVLFVFGLGFFLLHDKYCVFLPFYFTPFKIGLHVTLLSSSVSLALTSFHYDVIVCNWCVRVRLCAYTRNVTRLLCYRKTEQSKTLCFCTVLHLHLMDVVFITWFCILFFLLCPSFC